MKCLFFFRSKLSQNVSSEMWIFQRKLISEQKLNSKTEFLENIFLQNMIIQKVLFSKSAGTKNFQFKTWHFGNFSFQKFIVQENVFSESDYFFRKISFQTLIFNEKVCYKVVPFKMSTQSEKLVVFHGANRVKRLFLRCDVFFEIWFLNKNSTQKLSFWKKKFIPTNDYLKSFVFENLPRRNNSIQILTC